MLFHSGDGELRDGVDDRSTAVVRMVASFDGLIEVRSRGFRNTFATSVPMRRAASATKTAFCDVLILNFEDGLFGFNADREDGCSKRKCRRINPGFAYPRWQNSLARREQIAKQQRGLPTMFRVLEAHEAQSRIHRRHFFQAEPLRRPLFISTLRSYRRARVSLD